MKHRHNAQIRHFSSLLLVLAAIAANGCNWGDGLYERYMKDGNIEVCKGICKANNITQENCNGDNKQWDEAQCIIDGNNAPSIKDKIECESMNGAWIEGRCKLIDVDESSCDKENWVPFALYDIGGGDYLRFDSQNKTYYCGKYGNLSTTCDNSMYDTKRDVINAVKEDIDRGLCMTDTKCQIMQLKSKDSSNFEEVASCSTCPENQVICDGQCVDIMNNKDHCGGCDISCDTDKVCIEGNCVLGKKCDLGSIECGNNCINPFDTTTCGAQNCNDLGTDCSEFNKTCGPDKTCQDVEKCNESSVTCYCLKNKTKCISNTSGITNPNDYIITCISPQNTETCGVDTCEKLVDYFQNKDTYICNNNKACTNTAGVYKCTCPDNFVERNGECLDPHNDKTCGITNDTDGTDCTLMSGTVCDGKKCRCLAGTIDCSVMDDTSTANLCINPDIDLNNCGECNKKCGENEVCNKKCICKEGYARCSYGSDDCINIETDRSFCGAKGKCNSADPESSDFQGRKCGDDEECLEGECKCRQGTIRCGDECIDPKKDIKRCGATECEGNGSGIDCSIYDGAYCNSGNGCGCPIGFTLFTENDLIKRNGELLMGCINTSNDPRCCGPECKECDINSGKVCSNGCVQSNPPTGMINCKGKYLSIQDDHVQRDSSDEYGCICQGQYCPSDNNPNNGCNEKLIIDFPNDEKQIIPERGYINCGECGIHCARPYQYCSRTIVNGKPTFSCECNDGEIDCKYEDESNELMCINKKDKHLVGCKECESGYYNADGSWENGCEINLMNDPEHCGKYDVNCNDIVTNAKTISCDNGSCTALTCTNESFGNCDNSWLNGCEFNLAEANNENCRICGNKCENGMICKNNNGALNCCYEDTHGCEDCNIGKSDCCDNLTLYREYSWFFHIMKDNYKCASSTPDGRWDKVK